LRGIETVYVGLGDDVLGEVLAYGEFLAVEPVGRGGYGEGADG